MHSTLVDVIVENVENNPHCIHGPTLLFKNVKVERKAFYACSACRDRKHCNFYVPAENLKKESTEKLSNYWREQQKLAILAINKKNSYDTYVEILKSLTKNLTHKNRVGIKSKDYEKSVSDANYCYTCLCVFRKTDICHRKCQVLLNLTYHQLTHPTEIILPQTDSKANAQYFFSQKTLNDILILIKELNISKVLCIGVPRIHEFILHSYKNTIKSLLLDLDKNYYNFYSRKEFIWYNMFNNYIFDENQKEILSDYLSCQNVLVLLDPPFGGRVEPLALTLKKLSQLHRGSNLTNEFILETFWFFPYFMEQHITESLPSFRMFDYKVNYENHSSFTNTGSRKRKFGSPVRIFTNVPLSKLNLNGIAGYKFCDSCDLWVSKENRHCKECGACTSKDGRTYVHCQICKKCVKPTYKHCSQCQRCLLGDHVCGEFQPDMTCYHCHMPGHKKSSCPEIKNQHSESDKKFKKKKKNIAKANHLGRARMNNSFSSSPYF